MKHHIINTIIGIGLLLFITIAMNFLVSFSSLRKDCTEGQLYTLSDNTKDIIKNLKKKVFIRYYFSQTNSKIPLQYKNYAKRISNLLEEYQKESNSNVIIEQYNPTSGSNAEKCASLDSIYPQPLNTGENIYLGLSINCLNKTETFSFLTLKQESKLEYDLSRTILKVQSAKRKKIGLLSYLPITGEEKTPELVAANSEKIKPWIVLRELSKDFDIQPLNFDLKEIDEDIDALVLIHPVLLSKEIKNAVDQYILKGGKVLIFLDSYNRYFARKANEDENYKKIIASQFDEFLNAWGVKMDPWRVLGDMKYARRWKTAEKTITSTTALDITEEAFNKDEIALNQISILNYIYAGGLEYSKTEDNKNLTITPLINSSKNSQLIDRRLASNASLTFANFAADEKEYKMCIKIEGKFKTVFPKPLAVVGANKRLTEATEKGMVILVSDTDLLTNKITTRKEINELGKEYYKQINDNIVFVQNLVEYLTGEKKLMGIRTRKSIFRPFKVIVKMKGLAENELKDEYSKLNKEWQENKKILRNLQTLNKNNDGKIINKAQREELSRYKQKEKKILKKIKKVTDKYQISINSLIVKLKWINICLIPFLIIILGIGIAIKRKVKS